MKSTNSPKPASPYRRRRILWFLILATAGVLFYISTHSDSISWSLPSSLKDVGFSPSSSRVSKVAEAKAQAQAEAAQRRIRVQEIHGLLHFVTAYPDKRLDEEDGSIAVAGLGLVKVNPEEKIDLRVFSPDGDDNWEKHLKTLRTEHPLIVFSKTYCPFSRSAKKLLESYQISPPPTIVELDTRSDGQVIQSLLGRLTGRRTVPNILVQADSIGGSDDIHEMHDEHKLKTLLEEAGLEIHGI